MNLTDWPTELVQYLTEVALLSLCILRANLNARHKDSESLKGLR